MTCQLQNFQMKHVKRSQKMSSHRQTIPTVSYPAPRNSTTHRISKSHPIEIVDLTKDEEEEDDEPWIGTSMREPPSFQKEPLQQQRQHQRQPSKNTGTVNRNNHFPKIRKSSSSSEIPQERLQKSNLNISAGKVIYERARSRRQRHGLILSQSINAEYAIPLGKSGKRGPGRATDLPHEYYSDRQSRIYENDEEKVQALINAGRTSTTAFMTRTRNRKNRFQKKQMRKSSGWNSLIGRSLSRSDSGGSDCRKRRDSLSRKLYKSEKKVNGFLY